VDVFDLRSVFAGTPSPTVFSDGPLFVPGLMPRVDQRALLPLLQDFAGGRCPPLVRVPLEDDFVTSDLEFLRALSERRGGRESLVVVEILEAESDPGAVSQVDLFSRFDRVVVLVPHPRGDVPVGSFRALQRAVYGRLTQAVEEHSERFGVAIDGWNDIGADRFWNPLNILRAANELVRLHWRGERPDRPGARVAASVRARERSWRPREEIEAVYALAAGDAGTLHQRVPDAEVRARITASLNQQWLYVDGELQDWARPLMAGRHPRAEGGTRALRGEEWFGVAGDRLSTVASEAATACGAEPRIGELALARLAVSSQLVDNPEDWLTQRIRRWSRPAFAWEASLPDALSLVERVREDRDAFRGRAAEWEALRVATSTLSLRESALVEAVLVRRQAIEEVADAMGISAETATRSLRRAVDKLREQEG
jgi:hypothetical protein